MSKPPPIPEKMSCGCSFNVVTQDWNEFYCPKCEEVVCPGDMHTLALHLWNRLIEEKIKNRKNKL